LLILRPEIILPGLKGPGRVYWKSMKQTLRIITATLTFTSVFSGCSIQAGYLLKQGRYLVSDTSGTRRIDRVISDADTSGEVRDFLVRVQDIRGFAVEELGLKNNKNYTRYKVLGRSYLADVVQACDAASFTPFLWNYPLLGPMPYQGFYERNDAEAEATRLKALGYDVIVRKVDNFSTLGFFKDPVYSFLTSYSPGEIANLIIHEQAHATLFVKGQSDFNEEFATFVGDEGAKAWLLSRYGKDSTELREVEEERADAADFLSYLLELKGELSALYARGNASGVSRAEILARKQDAIASFKERYERDYAPLYRTEAYRGYTDLPINNAYLSLYNLYNGDVPLLRSYFEERCRSDLKLFIVRVREIAEEGGNVKDGIRSRLNP
jgi:predicted aminopeptidase